MGLILKFFVLIVTAVIPILVLAEIPGGSAGNPPIGSGGDVPFGGEGPTKINIKNPIGPDTLIEFVEAILGIIIQIGIPVLVVMIVYVGFKFVMAQGNDGKLTEAKTAFFWTIIGAAIVLGAFVISTVIQTTINNLGA